MLIKVINQEKLNAFLSYKLDRKEDEVHVLQNAFSFEDYKGNITFFDCIYRNGVIALKNENGEVFDLELLSTLDSMKSERFHECLKKAEFFKEFKKACEEKGLVIQINYLYD